MFNNQNQLLFKIIFKLFIFLLFFYLSNTKFCDETSQCLIKIRRMAQETNRFWFGEQWKYYCSQNQIKERQRHIKVFFF
jgi:hypothetical protein